MASGSITGIPVDVAVAVSTADRGTTCHVCIANSDHGSFSPTTVQQPQQKPQQQQQEENIINPPATLKTCLLCSNDYCARHEGEQEGVCASNHVSLWKKKMTSMEEKGQQHQEAGGSSRPAERKVRVFRSLEQRPQRA